MKLKDILIREGMYTTTQYWILPSGKVKKMSSGHEEYLTDEGMGYGKAFNTGHIRLAIAEDDGTPSAEWSKAATRPAKKALGNIVKNRGGKFSIKNGFHRFAAMMWLGYDKVPVHEI